MGFWHPNNDIGDGPDASVPGGTESIKRNDARICQDECSVFDPCFFNSSDPTAAGSELISPSNLTEIVPWRGGRRPVKDFVGSDSLLKPQDYVNYPDLQMLPALAGPIVPVYNIPELYESDSLTLSRLTLANIFNGSTLINKLFLFHYYTTLR